MKHLAIITALLINALALFVLAAVLAAPETHPATTEPAERTDQ